MSNAAAASAPSSPAYALPKKILDFMGGTVVRAIGEMYNMMPDSVLFGSLLLYFLTLNKSYGIFSAFIIELTLSHRLIAWIIAQSVGAPDKAKPIACRSGYKTPQMDVERMFNHEPYPSYGIFAIVSMATYLGFANSEFSSVADASGDNRKAQQTVAYTFMGLVVGTFILARMFLSNCDDTFGEILMAAGLAVVVGYLFFYLNKTIFGAESMNFLGLPYLAPNGVDANGNPSAAYICAAM